MTKPKIVLGLSGGVDSAVTARLLQENYTVIALYLSIGPEAAGEADARAVAEKLGIEFHTMNISEALERHVKAPFASDYLSGRTPLPCARCNPLVKFPSLLALAKEVGADYISTGHYARVEHSPAGRTLLKKGQPSNDQSYMLAQLPQGILQKVIFPLGNYNKDSIRAKAEAFGTSEASTSESEVTSGHTSGCGDVSVTSDDGSATHPGGCGDCTGSADWRRRERELMREEEQRECFFRFIVLMRWRVKKLMFSEIR